MDDDRSRRVLQAFREVLESEPEGRAAALTRACRDDPGLRADVARLLAAHDEGDAFLDDPPVLGAEPGIDRDGLVGKRLGDTLITRVISSGGMGVVYEAVQENPRRTVAVKVLREGLASRSALRRFEYEAQVLGRLHHPGIAQVYEAGIHATEEGVPGVPYFVMEHVAEARSITEYARVQGLDAEQRLRLFMDVCEAVHHGHQKGIIHRDLKPGNILVDPAGKVKVIDFGLARATDSDMTLTSGLTEVGQLVGTLQYMSPEQCLADPHDLDTRSDVYALGVVLYQLLCDRLPYDLRDLPLVEAVRRIRDEPPARPSTTVRALRGDLETILLKTLEKDRRRRYESAHEVRLDLERFLHRQPIAAHPPTVFYQLRTFAARNRALVGGIAGVFVVLVLGLITSTTLYLQAEAARAEVAREADMVRQINAFFNDMLASLDPLQLEAGASVPRPAPDEPRRPTGYARDVSMAEMLRWAAPRIEHTFAGKPEQQARVHETIGMAFFRLGLNHEARPQLQAALDLRSATLGESHEDTLRSKVQLADVLRWLGEYAAVESLLRPVLENLTRLLGDEDWQTQSCALVLAAALGHQGKDAEADRMFEETLHTQRHALGEEDRRTVWTMAEWAFDLARRGESRKAEMLAERAYEIGGRRFGPEDYVTVYSGGALGFLLAGRGEFARAESLVRPVLEARRRISGEEHPRTGISKAILAGTLRGEESLEERVRLYREALDGWRRNLGEGHFYLSVVTGGYAELLADRRRHEALEALLRERFEACRTELGEEKARTVEALQNLATFLLDRGRPAEGEALHRALLQSLRERLGDEAPATLAGLKLLADFHLRSGRLDAAAAELEDWVRSMARARGETHPATLHARTAAARALLEAGRTQQASEQTLAALAGWRRRTVSADASPRDFNTLAWQLLTCEPPGLRDPEQARSAAERAVALSESDDATILDTLALSYVLTGEPARAIETQRRALAAETTAPSWRSSTRFWPGGGSSSATATSNWRRCSPTRPDWCSRPIDPTWPSRGHVRPSNSGCAMRRETPHRTPPARWRCSAIAWRSLAATPRPNRCSCTAFRACRTSRWPMPSRPGNGRAAG
jgi:tetratricopeptide (TPR) repeat protein